MANRQKAVKMASRGASAKEIRQTTGVTGQAARNIVSRASTPAPVQTNAGTNPMGTRTPTPTTTKPTTFTQGLKIAGTGGITKQELNTISDTTGKSGEKVIQRLDALNQKLKGKDQVGISLNSGAANMLIKKAQKAYTRNPFTMPMQFGPGKIGQALEGMLGTRSTGGYINPQSGKQMFIPGVERTLLPRGMDLMPSGRQTVRGIGKQFTGMPSSKKGPYDGMMDNLDGNDQGPPPPPPTPIEPILPEELPEEPEEEQTPQFMSGSSADLANWATGFKSKRSSRKGAGPRAQGLGSQRVNPTGSFRGGM
jgi:hypothetical protein